MTRTPPSKRRVVLDLTEDIIANATRSNSAACVIADAIRAQVPRASRVSVDLGTCAWSDTKEGKRYTYLTPDAGRVVLFALDRGVRPGPQQLVLSRPIRVSAIKTSPSRAERNARKRADYEAKREAGTITPNEQRSLSQIVNTPPRPTSDGTAQVDDDGTVVGGTRPSKGGKREGPGGAGRIVPVKQLLPANVRVFGARLANYSDLDVLLEAAREQGRAEAESEHRGSG